MLLNLSWKSLMFYSIIFWGLWSFLGKIVMARIGWGAAFALLALTDLMFLLAIKPESFLFRFNFSYLLGLVMALCGTLGGITFYKTLEEGPATVVIPATALYIVVAAGLAIIFLGEDLTWNRILGLIFGVLAIFLLSRG